MSSNMHRKNRRKKARAARTGRNQEQGGGGVTTSLLSVNGELKSLFDMATANEPRANGYTEVSIGKPLVIRYLYFFLRHKAQKKNEVMISTFVKATETKQAAGEAVNFFDSDARFDGNNELRIADFGAEHYGHPLIYYTKSYLGESLYLTAKIMELDRVDQKVVDAIQKGIGTVSGLPVFVPFLPYTAGASVGVNLLQKLVDFINHDDSIVEGHDMDLHFKIPHSRHLQSARVVCVSGKTEAEMLDGGKYKLKENNRLVDKHSGAEYTETSYFVLQIDSKKNPKFDSFEHFMGAAELLKQTNRGGDPTELVNTMVDLFQGYNDISAIREIENLSIDVGDEKVNERIKALHRSMTNSARAVYKDRVKELTTNP